MDVNIRSEDVSMCSNWQKPLIITKDAEAKLLKEVPCYLFDSLRFKQNIEELRSRLSKGINLCYSVKSNPFMIDYALKYADLIEICSEGEWKICMKHNINASKIVAGGVYKSLSHIKSLTEHPPLRISVESRLQLEQLSQCASKLKRPQRVLLRITSGNQFGMDLNEISDIVAHASHYPYIDICGLHLYSSTRKKQSKLLDADFELLRRAAAESGIDSPQLEYGAGIGAPILNEDNNWFDNMYWQMINGVNKLSEEYPVTLELGRLLTGNIGVYITQIADIKYNCGKTFYVVEGGINHISYDGQIKGVHPPYIRNISNNPPKEPADTIRQEALLCGVLCTSEDVLAKDNIPESKVGDYLLFEYAGSYSVTEARSLFLSHPLPAVLINDGERIFKVRSHIDTFPLNSI